MNAPSVDIKDMLEAESSLGLVFATNLFIGMEPATPITCATIFDYYGYAPMLTMGEGENYEYPAIQIRVCSKDYTTAWTLAYNILSHLHGISHQSWNGTLYTVIYCSSGPALLDRDENGRFRIIINFNLQRR